MKRLMICLLALLMPMTGMAESQMELPGWLEQSGEGCVLTVRLPWQECFDWNFESSDPALDLLTMEILGDEPGEEGDLWVASFLSMGGGQEEIRLTLRCGEENAVPQEIRTVTMTAAEGGALTVLRAEIFPSAESWFAVDQAQQALYVCLPSNPSTGFGWSAESSDPELLKMTAEEFVSDAASKIVSGAGGDWFGSFGWEIGSVGDGVLTLRYARPWEDRAIETRTLRFSIDEEGRLSVVSAEIE